MKEVMWQKLFGKMFGFFKTKKYLLVGIILLFLFAPILASATHRERLCGPGEVSTLSSRCLQAELYNATHNPDGSPIDSEGDAIVDTILFPFKFIFTELANPVVSVAIKAVTVLLFTIFGILLALAGLLLNFSIELTIIKMSTFLEIEGIKTAWILIRDVANIGFIFAIVYIAISTILQTSGRGVKELMTKLIIAALLVNFSFFFTGVLIDASNILTIGIYKRINSVTTLDISKFDENGNPILNPDVSISDPAFFEDIRAVGISGIFVQKTNLTSLFTNSKYDTGTSLIVAIFGSTFIFMLTFAFLLVAILLFIRLIVLTILLITSPIAYLGQAFPGMSEYSKKWWDSLWSQLLFAPVYMVMTLVIILIISSPGFSNTLLGESNNNIGQAISTGFTTGSVGTIVNFLIIIGLLMASIIIAMKSASKGGPGISTAVGKASSYAAGSFGFVGRKTLGRAGAALASSDRLKKKSQETGFAGRVAKGTIFAGGALQKSSFDARATGVGGVVGGAFSAGKATGKGGAKKEFEDEAKVKAERAKLLLLSDEQAKGTEEYKTKMEKKEADLAQDEAILENERKDVEEKNEGKKEELREKKEKLEEVKSIEEGNRDQEVVSKLEKEISDLEKETKDLEEETGEMVKKINKKETENAKLLKEFEKDTTTDIKNRGVRAYQRSLYPKGEKEEAGGSALSNIFRFMRQARGAEIGRRLAREKIERDLKKSPQEKAWEDMREAAKKEVTAEIGGEEASTEEKPQEKEAPKSGEATT